MNMSFMQKIVAVFNYIVSSFLSIELFILCLLLFLLLVINIKKKNKYINYIILVTYFSFFISILIASFPYFVYSIDWLIKKFMNYIYFPSTAAYFIINIFSVSWIIYSIFSRKLTTFKKIFNFLIFNFLIYLFMSFVVVVTYNKLDISIVEELYNNNVVLAIVQISNLLLFGWFLFTLFYRLYLFFKRNFDKKIGN